MWLNDAEVRDLLATARRRSRERVERAPDGSLRDGIVAAVRASGGGMRVRDVAAIVERTPREIGAVVERLRRRGVIERVGRGFYAAVPT